MNRISWPCCGNALHDVFSVLSRAIRHGWVELETTGGGDGAMKRGNHLWRGDL